MKRFSVVLFAFGVLFYAGGNWMLASGMNVVVAPSRLGVGIDLGFYVGALGGGLFIAAVLLTLSFLPFNLRKARAARQSASGLLMGTYREAGLSEFADRSGLHHDLPAFPVISFTRTGIEVWGRGSTAVARASWGEVEDIRREDSNGSRWPRVLVEMREGPPLRFIVAREGFELAAITRAEQLEGVVRDLEVIKTGADS